MQIEAEAPGAALYRYRGSEGRIVIVDSIEKVPRERRATVERVAIERRPGAAELAWLRAPWAHRIGAAVACVLVVGLVALALRRVQRRGLRFSLVAVALLLSGALYVGLLFVSRAWVDAGRARALAAQPRSSAPSALEPTTINPLENAQRSVNLLNRHNEAQERVIDEAYCESH